MLVRRVPGLHPSLVAIVFVRSHSVRLFYSLLLRCFDSQNDCDVQNVKDKRSSTVEHSYGCVVDDLNSGNMEEVNGILLVEAEDFGPFYYF